MKTSIVFTFIGADKPGLIEKLSNTVSEQGGNWLESRMSQLAGHFAGITRVQISSDRADNLRTALEAISSAELNISIQPDNANENHIDCKHWVLSLIGNDHPGIVRELTSALAARNINVCVMNTNVTSAPMTAQPLFEATADIQVPTSLDMDELTDKLDEIADDLAIDINLQS
ncbi:MAG: ACT domain-containing protein [Pseudomonadales bacterium]